jgi:pimeloyl-ACP methyl ester carboxylesterase
MATIVIVPGACSGGRTWIKVTRRFRAAGHAVWPLTLTGLGERAHLLTPEVDLDTHVRDVLGMLTYEDLTDVVLIGHSYSGMVLPGVADRAPERIARLVYLDAYVPEDGQAMFDLMPADDRRWFEEAARAGGDGWRWPVTRAVMTEILPNATPDDLDWIMATTSPHPLRTFAQPVRLTRPADPPVPRTYVYCTHKPENDVFAQFARRARNEPGWCYRELDADHGPNITAPVALAGLLLELV